MKLLPGIFIFLLSVTLSSCGAIETIFKAGMWWAIFLIAIVIGVILYVVYKARK